MFGKLYAEFTVTWVFLAVPGLFELGSIVCAGTPNSLALIIGRAAADIACPDISSGTFIIAESFPLHKRPVYTNGVQEMSEKHNKELKHRVYLYLIYRRHSFTGILRPKDGKW